ncbi:hypothetical protein QQ020_33540 [Fulvivirgaceae bacterium BMA12]|uniref:Lipoprotein n=1 Tax=Agaribacillus aureus TaxID=3051825 RepID=A0ABT8LHN5_9BACT|nr:hypothetical protein [Fulvivirgaceae bacterium BMA12]
MNLTVNKKFVRVALSGILSPVLWLALLTLTNCTLYDLRPEALRQSVEISDDQRGDQIMEKAAIAHGWDQLGDIKVEAIYRDHWPSDLMRWLFHPWPSHAQLIKHTFTNYDLYSGEVEFLDGKDSGELWGLENGQPFLHKNKKKEFRKHKSTSFYLPTYQYFMQIGYWIKNIPIRKFLKEEQINGRTYLVLLATWNKLSPQKDYDQYIFYINKESYLIEMVEYTIRAQFPSAHGTNTFSDFKKTGDLMIPYKQTITVNPEDQKIVHQLVLEKFSYWPI